MKGKIENGLRVAIDYKLDISRTVGPGFQQEYHTIIGLQQ